MQNFRKEVPINNLVIGEKYYASGKNKEWFIGVFSEYWINTSGYLMVRFSNTFYYTSMFTIYIGSREQDIAGFYWRVFDKYEQQSFKYYNNSLFTIVQKKELLDRYILRERRQYHIGLTGSTKLGKWLPYNIVREIIKYII